LTSLAPLLDEIALAMLSRDIALIPVVQTKIDNMSQSEPDETSRTKAMLSAWAEDLRERGANLRALEQIPKRRHMQRLLFQGRPATNEELLRAFAPDVDQQPRA
jgi:hypothetical protein